MWLRPRRDPLLLAIAGGLPSELLLTIYHQVLRIWLERPRYHLRERPRRGCSITVACAWAVFIQERQYYLAVDPATTLVGVYRRGVKPGQLTVSCCLRSDRSMSLTYPSFITSSVLSRPLLTSLATSGLS